MKILITDLFDPDLLPEFKIKYDIFHKPTISYEELANEIKNYDILIISTRIQIDAKLLEKAGKLKLLIRMGIGVDHIDLNECRKRKILVCNTPYSNISSVVELIFGQIIRYLRNTDIAHDYVLKGQFRAGFPIGEELKGKTLGIIGVGRIGTRLSKLAKVFEMNVLGYDPYITLKKKRQTSVDKFTDLSGLISSSDIVSLNVPLTAETKYMVNNDFLLKMKKGSILVNISRGMVVNYNDVIEFAKKRIIRKFIIDVFEKEPFKPEIPQELLDYFYFSPHIGAYTKESVYNRSKEAIEEIEEYFLGKTPHGKINLKKGY